MDLLAIADRLTRDLRPIRFAAPVTHVYNPLQYARAAYAKYVSLYGTKEREVLLLGMNPGPWGMAQTGVPFGAVGIVRDWLRIAAPVGKPDGEHPARPVLGFECRREEVSGTRLWGWARDRFQTPERFFDRVCVINYCPLVFMESSGRNRTPDKLPPEERVALLAACDDALRKTVEHFRPRVVVGVGKFAESRAMAALSELEVRVTGVLHPSPANPRANRNWSKEMDALAKTLGIGAAPRRAASLS